MPLFLSEVDEELADDEENENGERAGHAGREHAAKNDGEVDGDNVLVGRGHELAKILLAGLGLAEEIAVKGKTVEDEHGEDGPAEVGDEREVLVFKGITRVGEGEEKDEVPGAESAVVDGEEGGEEEFLKPVGARGAQYFEEVVEADDEVLKPVEQQDVLDVPAKEEDAGERKEVGEKKQEVAHGLIGAGG